MHSASSGKVHQLPLKPADTLGFFNVHRAFLLTGFTGRAAEYYATSSCTYITAREIFLAITRFPTT